MRRRIDTSGIEFRVAAMPLARTVSRQDKTQKVTRDGRPVWVVKLTAFDPGVGPHGSTEQIWVEIAGPEPSLVNNQLATVAGPCTHRGSTGTTKWSRRSAPTRSPWRTAAAAPPSCRCRGGVAAPPLGTSVPVPHPVIKEIPVMTAVPAETGSRLAARALALSLVQALALGLPDPDYITISPWAADIPSLSMIDFQFSEGDSLSAVQDWADRFDVTVTRAA